MEVRTLKKHGIIIQMNSGMIMEACNARKNRIKYLNNIFNDRNAR